MSRPADRRSRSNRNDRGSSYERRRRREWLVEEFGDGEFVACFLQRSPHCLYVLDKDNVSADRIVLGVGWRHVPARQHPARVLAVSVPPGWRGWAGAESPPARRLTPTIAVGYDSHISRNNPRGKDPEQ